MQAKDHDAQLIARLLETTAAGLDRQVWYSFPVQTRTGDARRSAAVVGPRRCDGRRPRRPSR